MMRSTRSASGKSLSETVDSSLTADEAEILRQSLEEREKRIREQAEALEAPEMELQERTQQESQRSFKLYS